MKFKADDFNRYPAMERQDLNQSQLGSFKFTPIDPEPRNRRQWSRDTLWTDHRIQSVADSFMGGSGDRGGRFQNEDVNTGRTLTTCSSAGPRHSGDFEFFDHHIKQNLADSRLRLGVAAIRQAVDSASASPEKSHVHAEEKDQSFYRPYLCANMNPDAAMFLPATTMSFDHLSSQPNTNMENTLSRALASEQEAHETTRFELQDSVDICAKLEQDIKNLEAEKKSNQATIRTQRAIIAKLQEDVKYLTIKAELSPVDSESSTSTDSNKAVVSYAGARVPSSIFYDVLKRQRETYEHRLLEKEEVAYEDGVASTSPQNSDSVECTYITAEMLDELVKMLESRQGPEITSPDVDASTPVLQDASNSQKLQHNSAQAGQVDKHSTAIVPKLQKTETPMLDLPSELLAKYAKKPATSKDVKVLSIPYAPTINWKVHSYDELVNDDIKYYHAPVNGIPFYKWPVRFLPDQADSNIFRTVMIDGIPLGTTYQDILPQIRGGSLESIQLFGPLGTTTNFMTARLVFNFEGSANHVYLRYSKADPLVIRGHPVRVWMPDTPTYPKSAQLTTDVFENCYTRVLLIENAGDETFELIPEKLRDEIRAEAVVNVTRSEPMTRTIEFTSVADATKAFRLLLTDPDFGGAVFDFDDDPCAEEYKD